MKHFQYSSDFKFNSVIIKNKQICPKCGNKPVMYYSQWCMTCDPPYLSKKNVMNLIQVKNYLNVIDSNFDERSTWRTICDIYYFRNDSSFVHHFRKYHSLSNFDDLLEKYFGVSHDLTFWVSW